MSRRMAAPSRGSLARWLARLAAAALLSLGGAAAAADVRVMISAGFYRAYSELAPAFERRSGHRLITTRGPSMGDSPEAIPNRLERGEPADVVIGIGASIDDLSRRALVRAGSKVDLARSQIGMVVRAGASRPDIGTVEAFKGTLLLGRLNREIVGVLKSPEVARAIEAQGGVVVGSDAGTAAQRLQSEFASTAKLVEAVHLRLDD
jgi:ABC-type molybdate transport system substrate-binding protein